MIIDDDAEFAGNFATFLEKDGHNVTILDSTEGATGVLAESKPDMLVLDVMFPESPAAGFDLARKIRKTEEIKDLPILMLTGVNQEFPMDFSSGDIDPDWLPVEDFVEKNSAPDVIVSKIQELLARSSGE